MKVFIGKYRRDFFGASMDLFFERIGFSEKNSERISDFLWDRCKFGKLSEWLYNVYTSKRKIKVRVDDYDIYNLDHTLAKIIYPCLVTYRNNKFSYFIADKGDAPSLYHEDELGRWNWIVGEMIFAFNEIANNPDGDLAFFKANVGYSVEYESYDIRVKNGLKLFGKYYRALWT